jgi:hypothetical protein
MEVRNHLSHARNAARHAANQVMLIPVVDPHIRMGRPDQHRLDSPIPPLQIVHVPVHGVVPRHRIVEVAILNHHLRLNETGLRPLERRKVVAGTVIPCADTAFIPPMADVGQSRFVFGLAAEFDATRPKIFHCQTFWDRNLLTSWRETRISRWQATSRPQTGAAWISWRPILQIPTQSAT